MRILKFSEGRWRHGWKGTEKLETF